MSSVDELQKLILEDVNPDPYKLPPTERLVAIQQPTQPEIDLKERQKMSEDEYILSLADEAQEKIATLIQNKLNLQGVDFEISRGIITGLLDIINMVDNNNDAINRTLDHINNAARVSQMGGGLSL